jgi:hypothetical protein
MLLSKVTNLSIEYCDKILFCTKGKYKYKKYLAACTEETPFYPILSSACASPQEPLPKLSKAKNAKTRGKSTKSTARGGRSKKNKTRRNN